VNTLYFKHRRCCHVCECIKEELIKKCNISTGKFFQMDKQSAGTGVWFDALSN